MSLGNTSMSNSRRELSLPVYAFLSKEIFLKSTQNAYHISSTRIILCGYIFFFFSLSLFIYFERECVCVHQWGRGREREGERESQAGSSLSVQRPIWGLIPWNREIMTWAEINSWTLTQLRHPGAPHVLIFEQEDNHYQSQLVVSIRFYSWSRKNGYYIDNQPMICSTICLATSKKKKKKVYGAPIMCSGFGGTDIIV